MRSLRRHWNWKSAVVSSACRASIFFLVNLPSGTGAAMAALRVEFVYRALAAGWYGALTERFGRRPVGARTTMAALVVVPGIAHCLEFVVHWIAGTPRLGSSVAASAAFSVVTTAFNLFAMRRGALVVGPGSRPLREDLAALPGLVTAFVRGSWNGSAFGASD